MGLSPIPTGGASAASHHTQKKQKGSGDPIPSALNALHSPFLKKSRSRRPVAEASLAPFIPAEISGLYPELQMAAMRVQEWAAGNQISETLGEAIHAKLKFVCLNYKWNDHRKRAELALLYFYLVSEYDVPLEKSLVEKRVRELHKHALELRSMCARACPPGTSELIPSGAIAYLMRALVRAILPPDGTFNEDGCCAVIEILNSRVGLLISEEHRGQMIAIAERLRVDVNLKGTLMRPFDVHPDVEELIRLDLKLPPGADIPCEYVR